jgi:hypothetical protein
MKLSIRGGRLASALLLLACGDSTEPLAPTTLSANSNATITGVAGAVVTPSPSVIVRDQNGAPMADITVTFQVASGGGSVSGGTVNTSAEGIATVGAWTLGTVPGQNTLTATSGSLAAVTFTATSTPGVPASIAKNAGDNQTAAAGAAVGAPPSAIIRDANGNPVPGVEVTFAVTGGGGAVTGATQTTNSSGIATVGAWTLGNTPGANTLSATSGTLGTVSFTATGTVGAAASVAKNAGDNQSAVAGTPVAIPPSVIVRDAVGNPRAGVAVTFAVASGGGSITGASATTGADGVAAVGSWTLGAIGLNTLTATATGLPSVTFSAQAVSNFCTTRSDHTFGTVSSGTLSSTDCQFNDGSFVDFYTTMIPQSGAYLFRQGAAFDAYLVITTPEGIPIGENDDETPTVTNSAVKALLPAGNYLIGPGSFLPGITGAYDISSTTTSSDVANCEVVFVVRNVTTPQNLASSDCNLGSGSSPIYADGYFIFMTAGSSVTVNMTSASLDSYLQLRSLDGAVVAQNDNVDGSSNARVTYTATQSNYYAIFARSAPGASLGTYTLSVQ